MEKDQIVNELYMPYGLKLRKEYAQGFGKKELIATIIAALVMVIVDCIIFIAGVRAVGILFFVPLIGTSVAAMMQIKGELNLSPVDIIKMEIAFMKEQHKYPYVAKDEWKNV